MHEFGVFIGRFQPFHNAHYETVKLALQKCKRLIIVIGSDNQARTTKNPWTSQERIAMIASCFGGLGGMNQNEELDRITFIPARDHLYNDNLWLVTVQQAIAEATNNSKDVVLIGHKKDASSFYLKQFPQWEFIETGNHCHETVEASHIRDLMFTQDKIGIKPLVPSSVYMKLMGFMQSSQEFKTLHEEYHHILDYRSAWKGAPFPPVFVTTDVVVIKSGHVLVVRRRCAPGKGLVALPGGFLQQDEKVIDGAIRELKEETGIKLSMAELKDAVCGEKVFDDPNRSLRGRTITHAFCIDLGRGSLPQVKGSDDAARAWWMPLSDVFAKESQFFEDHFYVINHFALKF